MRRLRLGPLGVRFAASFVGVALAAIVVFAVAVLIADQGNVARLAANDRDRTVAGVVALAGNAYQSAGDWQHADLRPVTVFAEQAGIAVDIKDQAGSPVLSVAAKPAAASQHPQLVEQAVSLSNASVGTAEVAFPAGGLNPGDRHLRSALLTAIGWSAGLAVLGALIVGVLVARGVVRPIRRLSAAVSALRLHGDSPRVGPQAGPGELGELGRAFDNMAASLAEEDRLRRALVADVAHELRTPVAIMQAETEALADGLVAPSTAALTSLHEEAIRLARMVEDLQTLASAEAAGVELQPRPLDLGRLAADAADSLASRFWAGHITVEQHLPPTPVVGDPRRLHQIVTNLLANAAKYTPPGGKVTVRASSDGPDALLEVTDTGPGIPEDERGLVWERFYRGRSGRLADGSGIGLAVVKELVNAHGGRVSIDTATGGGAKFSVRLPQAPIAPTAAGAATSLEATTAAAAGAATAATSTTSPTPAPTPRD
jgi:signal transduction histidine kinase